MEVFLSIILNPYIDVAVISWAIAQFIKFITNGFKNANRTFYLPADTIEKNPEIILYIAGSNPTKDVLELANDNIKIFTDHISAELLCFLTVFFGLGLFSTYNSYI